MELTEKDERRFWSKVALPNEQGCMLWLGYVEKGYGRFWFNGRMVRAHRVSYLLSYGPIPSGTEIDHVRARGCTNKHCVAPDHLEAVTHAENIRRGSASVAMVLRQTSKTHCPQGHPYSEENTRIARRGRWTMRHCRTCDSTRARKAKAS